MNLRNHKLMVVRGIFGTKREEVTEDWCIMRSFVIFNIYQTLLA
jgi:hypothetical protein